MTKKPEKKPTFGFVVLRQLNIPTNEAMLSALKEFLPADTAITELSIDDEFVSFKVNNQSVMFAHLDCQIPWSDLEGPCATSWLWPEATEEMKSHQSHLLVMLNSDKGSLIDQCLLLTRVMAAASKAFNAIGIYWGHGSVVMSAAQFEKVAAVSSFEHLPMFAWIDFRIQKNPDGSMNVLTTGLDYFGCMEIEILHTKRPPEEVMDLATGVATITLWGDVIKDGDIVGHDAETKIKVRHSKSKWDREGKVLRVEM